MGASCCRASPTGLPYFAAVGVLGQLWRNPGVPPAPVMGLLFQQTHDPAIDPEDLQQPVQRGVQGDGQRRRQAGGGGRARQDAGFLAGADGGVLGSISVNAGFVRAGLLRVFACHRLPLPISLSGRLGLCRRRRALAAQQPLRTRDLT